MEVIVEGLGPFPATDAESKYLEELAVKHPELSPKDCLRLLYVARCVQLAYDSVTRESPAGYHVCAIDLLRVGELAALQLFGERAQDWLLALGVRSSKEFGALIFRFVQLGALVITQSDRQEDFDQISPFDAFVTKA
jgi:uncharacterized repeat protein (TIGR04138 family)